MKKLIALPLLFIIAISACANDFPDISVKELQKALKEVMLPLLILMVLEHLTKVTSLPRFTIQLKDKLSSFYPRTRTLSLFLWWTRLSTYKRGAEAAVKLVTKMLSIFLLGFQVGKGLEQKIQ